MINNIEEQRNLQTFISHINKEIDSSSGVLKNMGGRYNINADYSKDGYASFIDTQSSIKNKQLKLQKLKRLSSNPYFARVDLKERTRTNSWKLYLTEEDISIAELELISKKLGYQIVNYNAPIASSYYMKSDLVFSHNEFVYDIYLRRRLTIVNGELTHIEDELVRDDGSQNGYITDPFLISVLKEKKKSKALTDIIRTMQANQNFIVRDDINKNILVQGCAGSGKTMILMQRLAYMKYNNPSLNLDSIKVITPSKNFDMHIEGVVQKLSLEKIKKLTMGEYYLELLKTYDFKSHTATKFSDEQQLEPELLCFIYSNEFKSLFIKNCENAKRKILNKHLGERIKAIFKKQGIVFNSDVSINDLIEIHKLSISKSNSNQMEINNLMKEIERKEDQIAKTKIDLNQYITMLDLQTQSKSTNQSDNRNNTIIIQRERQRLQYRVDKLELENKKLWHQFELKSKKELSADEISIIEKSLTLLKKIKLNEFFINAYSQSLSNFLEVNKVKYSFSPNKMYRFELYVSLLFANLHMKKRYIQDKYLFIDEAQELALNEYKILSDIFDGDVIFNVFGDTNQLTKQGQGIDDWGVLKGVLSFEYYSLNENYRNTDQIIHYCNEIFNLNVVPLGVSGKDVERFCVQDICIAVTKLRLVSENKVVIVKNNTLKKEFQQITSDIQDMEFLDIMTVEEVKGIEYHTVMVYTKDMSKNELYVSFTRALADLVVIICNE